MLSFWENMSMKYKCKLNEYNFPKHIIELFYKGGCTFYERFQLEFY